tara:strand:+ start:285 stop:737 length:453 start_codon:yes stop_codon:yes gene_type:complete
MYTTHRDQSCEPILDLDIRRSKVWKIDNEVGEIVDSNFIYDVVRYKISESRRGLCVGYEYIYDFKMGIQSLRRLAFDMYNITKTFIWRSNRHELALAMLYQDNFRSQYKFFIEYLEDQHGLCADVTRLILKNVVDTSVNVGQSVKIVYEK